MQPWASLLCAGIKEVETRSWKTSYRGKVYIHASRVLIDPTPEMVKLIPVDKWVGKGLLLCPTGGIIGSVEIVDCITADQFKVQYPGIVEKETILGDLTPGRYAWICKNPVLFKEIIPCKGALSFWNIPADVMEKIENAKAVL